MKLKEYQNSAVEKLLTRCKDLLSQNSNKKMVFHAPTGSGKTIMAAEFLKKLANDKESLPASYIWIAPGKLHIQSKDKLEEYYKNSLELECSYFNDLIDKKIGENEILFLNWESIRQEGNIIIRENEQEFYLHKILENTKEDGRNIILIIDESQRAAKTEISEDLVADIAPKLALEVSATPIMKNADELVRIQLDEVKKEGMIKKSVILNDGLENILTKNGITPAYAGRADDFILKQALTKREELVAAFQAVGSSVNPLLCIQLPDRQIQQDENIKNNVLQTLKNEFGITEENNKLAIYLSEEKENLENIARNDNAAEVMIFKQAIALGWDCPRAHILVLFRNWHSGSFSVQTLGRIMRMSEPDIGHYENEILNKAYVYTNKQEVFINEDVAGGYIRIYSSLRTNKYAFPTLSSVHRIRQREKTRLSPMFNKLFLLAAKEYKLKDKIEMENQTVHTDFISDYQMENIDTSVGKNIEGEVRVDVSNKEDLQRLFDYFVGEHLSPYYPDDRSIGRVRKAIYDFFGGPLEMDYIKHYEKIINITLSEDNAEHFVNVLNETKDKYKAETESRKEELQKTQYWEFPKEITYSENYETRALVKSIMQPFYAAKNESRPEKEFIELLENTKSVKWWYKNGEGDSLYFAVPYTENDEEKPFYVDFIVQFEDDTIGLYDTKSGITLDVAKNKSDGLLKYIKESKSPKTQKLHGGIVTPANNNFQGWKIYIGKGADLSQVTTTDGWDFLDLSKYTKK